MSAWLAETLLATTVLMLLVLALRLPVAHLFGAQWAYALWLLPALRLVMPPLPAESLPAPPLVIELPALAERAASLPSDGGPGQWVPILLAAWAGGAALFILWQWLGYRALVRRLPAGSTDSGRYRGLPVIRSSVVDGPLVIGIVAPRIIVPADFNERYSAAEQTLALEHEHVHQRRGDLWWNLAALAVLAAHWFNPVAWTAFRAFRTDQELSCDALVAAKASPESRCAYASALVKSASRPGLVAACPLNHADQLKRRLKMMKQHRQSRARTLGGAAALALVGVASIALSAPGMAQEKEEDGVRRIKIIELSDANMKDRAHVLRLDPDRLPPECADNRVLDVDERNDGDRKRVVLCVTGKEEPADRLQALERARKRISEEEGLSGDARDRVLAELDEQIAKLRGN